MSAALRFAAPLLLVLLGAVEPVVSPSPPAAAKPTETHYFPAEANGLAVFDGALAEAKASGKSAVIVFGADWCHDSRGLAKVLTSDKFKTEFAGRYVVTFIDVGVPQTGNGRNLDLVGKLGIRKLKSTPAMFVVSPKGKRINSKKDAVSWRNADSRSEVEILQWFRTLDRN